MNNSSTDDTNNIDNVSLYLLKVQWPVYIIWLVCTSLNFSSAAATIFGLVAYKVATLSLRLYLSLQMVLEIFNAVSVSATAWLHLQNFLLARPETMLVRRCFMWDQNLHKSVWKSIINYCHQPILMIRQKTLIFYQNE